MQNETEIESTASAAKHAPSIGKLQQLVTDLVVRTAFAIHHNAPAAMPKREELIGVAMTALDVAAAEVPAADVCHVESTRRYFVDALTGCPTAKVAKRDALFTVGVLFDAGLLDAFTELVEGELARSIATEAISNMTAERIAEYAVRAERLVTGKVGGK
jgi:hypothetical protein